MDTGEATFSSKVLMRQRTPEEYALYRAALEWDLTDPIVLEGPEDFKSAQRWRDRLTPYHHQVTNLITFCRRLPVTLLADDVGLGKTISAGLIISELVSRARLSKILIVCPKLLCPQWQEELAEKFDIASDVATGRELLEAEPEDVGAIITTYNSARLYLDRIPEDRFQMLILDEAHKLRNLYGTEKSPQVAVRFRKALEARRFRFVLMLTATPIQNRLWDLYSLVDLLTVARGHQNPFGSEGLFARRFIADRRDQARQLKHEAREEFRSIVYGYMSRVRRGDAKLYFPDRVVQMHRVNPTPAELELIAALAKPIQSLNKLAQISILQALTSSPDALLAQLTNMARNGTFPPELAQTVRGIVTKMPLSAKLRGLQHLIEQLRKENADGWRLVVFTGRRETQTTIQTFLAGYGLRVGIINGESGPRNQDTLARFRSSPPQLRVIVSTEAGSEGVNLQVANVLVNFDLPWNPMIVEQRIGRVQRLASLHAHVSIFNIMLRGTFEEYIVGRLMEKLQMAAHAVGDIEALLQGSDIAEGDDDAGLSFEDRILKLVLAALTGKDTETETRLAEQSIAQAKVDLEREEANINAMLGSMDGTGYVGPRAPRLPSVDHSMDARSFTLAALPHLGAKLTEVPPDLHLAIEDGGRDYIRFASTTRTDIRTTLYAPGTPAFQRLVGRVIASGVHDITDLDIQPAERTKAMVNDWIDSLGAQRGHIELTNARRCFSGNALLRVRATVAHDSYERLVEVACAAADHRGPQRNSSLESIAPVIEDAKALGIDPSHLLSSASRDPAISEFVRFYLERRDHESKAAGEDERKRTKLFDEFTPRLEMTLVGLTGTLHREVEVSAAYSFDGPVEYESQLLISPHDANIIAKPELATCSRSRKRVPTSCLAKCSISNAFALKHYLIASDLSQRKALPELTVTCAVTGQRVLRDEADLSTVTGRQVALPYLKTSGVSAKRAEAEHFGRCEFTGTDALTSELTVSELTCKQFRSDQILRSAVSGKVGHKDEFTFCHVTCQPIARSEAEQCEVSGHLVRPGVLERCDVSGKRVLPSELERCPESSKRALRKLFATSSVSGARALEEGCIRSAGGNFCLPSEARACAWSERSSHPDDLKVCALTGLTIRSQFLTAEAPFKLAPLVELLNGVIKAADESHLWGRIAESFQAALKRGKTRIESAILSPSNRRLAVVAEHRTLLGLRSSYVGAVYNLAEGRLLGRLAEGKREGATWSERRVSG
jgi:ERCC4-related helicase